MKGDGLEVTSHSAPQAPRRARWFKRKDIWRGDETPGSASTRERFPGERAFGANFDGTGGADWQRLWLATQRRPWRSLAVIPVGYGIRTLVVSQTLAAAGSCHLRSNVQVADATTITLNVLRARMDAWMNSDGSIARVLIALGPVLDSPPGLAVAQAADAAILCLELGGSSIPEAERIIAEVGKERFLGSVILRKGRVQRGASRAAGAAPVTGGR